MAELCYMALPGYSGLLYLTIV